jgi:uroporphyrinogen-III synthase
VLVLRAREQQAELTARLARAGAEPVAVPLLDFEACGGDERIPTRGLDWIVFASANAVRFALPRLDRAAFAVPVACVGAATAEAARRAGLQVEVVPEAGALPQSMADALSLRASLRGARVLLPRAESGLEALGQELQGRGATVDALTVYRNVQPPESSASLRKALEAGVDAVLLTSPSCVGRLSDALGSEVLRELAGDAVLACIGPTTADALRSVGLEPSVLAERATGEDLIRALERHFAEHPDGLPA